MKNMDLFSIIILFFTIVISVVFTGIFFDAVWIPTRKKNYDRIAKLSDLKPGMIFYDLGSGSANMLFYLSKKYNIKCIGIEISPFWFIYSKIKSLFYKGVEIKYGNFYRYNLSKADVVYAFLIPKTYPKLNNKIKKELKKESKLILSYWPFKDEKPNKIAKKEGLPPYYLYQK